MPHSKVKRQIHLVSFNFHMSCAFLYEDFPPCYYSGLVGLCRFDGRQMLRMLRGKRMVFVGDSLNRNMWQSLVCALRESVENKSRIFQIEGRREFRTRGFYSFNFLVS